MRTQLRQVGNSIGQIIPAPILQELDLKVGDELDLAVHNGQIIVQPMRKRPKYTLDELLAKCDENATSVSEELSAWENMESVGLENDF